MADELVKLATADELADGDTKTVRIGIYEILLIRIGDEYLAMDNLCSHNGGPLNLGMLEGDQVLCPWHDSKFNIRTGDVTGGPAIGCQRIFPVTVTDGDILVSKP